MLRGRTVLICAFCLFARLCAAEAATAEAQGMPYEGIVDRNVFGLKPPPPPPIVEPQRAPPPKLILTGITSILGNKRALLMLQQPNKPPESLMLEVGQSSGEIEILAIDTDAGTVKVRNHGVEQTLDFESDGAKPGATPLPNVPRPRVNPTIGPTGTPPSRNYPTRTLRLPPAPGSTVNRASQPSAPPEPVR
jgi:hypothetical protein